MFVDVEQSLCHRQVDVLTLTVAFALKQRRQDRARTLNCGIDVGMAERVVGVLPPACVALTLR